MKKNVPKKRVIRTFVFWSAVLLLAFCISACQKKDDVMQDGFYSAEAAEFDSHGWKEYITIYVSKNEITTVDYNAKNASGFIKSWDMNYMRTMNATDGIYPNKYVREYVAALLEEQDADKIDAISGATHSYASFKELVKAVMAQARVGDHTVAYVVLTEAAE